MNVFLFVHKNKWVACKGDLSIELFNRLVVFARNNAVFVRDGKIMLLIRFSTHYDKNWGITEKTRLVDMKIVFVFALASIQTN